MYIQQIILISKVYDRLKNTPIDKRRLELQKITKELENGNFSY